MMLIGWPRVNNYMGVMGYRFMSDGSVWMGDSDTFELTGILVHFRPDGHVEAGYFENGRLEQGMPLKGLLEYYSMFVDLDGYDSLPVIDPEKNYFATNE